ncbi:class I SAM-dependent methyltransferase [Streptomyces sp. NPDC018972]|uniref:class I SAM-dependent methyltransferase n=1 Tax=Streptomyces sp. NPDC018972 TaxID=3365060 RepID=UPI00378B4607
MTPVDDHADAQALSHLTDFLTGDAAQLPFEDESFDALYSIRAIRHTPDKARVHAEVARVLKSGGVHLGNDWFQAEGLTAEWQEHCAEPVCQGTAPPSLFTPGRAGPSPQGGEPGACSTTTWSSPHAVPQGPRGRDGVGRNRRRPGPDQRLGGYGRRAGSSHVGRHSESVTELMGSRLKYRPSWA